MLACKNGHKDVVAYLLEQGADVKARELNGRVALHYAAAFGHAQLVPLLLQKGAEIEHGDQDGTTALMLAIAGGHVAAVKALIDDKVNGVAKADVKAKNKQGKVVKQSQ